jgi:hypothetical protein
MNKFRKLGVHPVGQNEHFSGAAKRIDKRDGALNPAIALQWTIAPLRRGTFCFLAARR